MTRFGLLTRVLLVAAPVALCSAAWADDPCEILESKDGTSLNIVNVGASSGECSVELADGTTLFSSVDPSLDHCSTYKIGNNPIVIWPANSEGGYCRIGNNTIVVWP